MFLKMSAGELADYKYTRLKLRNELLYRVFCFCCFVVDSTFLLKNGRMNVGKATISDCL